MRFLFAAVAIAFRMANAKTILLSEVYVRPTIGERGQFIELFNPTGIMVDMSKYKVCVGSGSPCTNLSGFLPAGAYYSICRDLSVYAYCNAGTALKLDGLAGSAAGVKLIDTTGAVVDSATWPELPVGVSIARGLDLSNLMTFVSTTIPSIGSGFVEGLAPTSNPTLAPSPMPSSDPTPEPSNLPTLAPTEVPTPLPTTAPPTNPPTLSPTELCAKASCHKLADCTISNGIASCKCKSGYVGDGTLICDDIDECSQTPFPCSQNGFCANRLGSYRCGCKRGYAGDGVVCVDIDECLGNPCGANTFCTNSQGSFSCKCNPGFRLDTDVSCSDIDECSASPRPCDRRAYCVNNVGGYYCECKAGYFGTGYGAGSCSLISSNPVTSPGITSKPITPTRPTISRPNVPSVSLEPSMSFGPTITRFPSLTPSFSDEPTATIVPSVSPSLSDVPSVTSFPSARPSTRSK